jgi:hypothetical protein
MIYFFQFDIKVVRRLTIGNPHSRGSSMKHFFLKIGPNTKDLSIH